MKTTTLFITLLLLSTPSPSQETNLLIKEHIFRVETAVTDQERTEGLMYRREMPQNHGMLFIYPAPRLLSFWMKETYLTLDILFFDHERRLINLFTNVRPCITLPCPKYRSRKEALYALEIHGGTALKLELEIGDKFTLEPREKPPITAAFQTEQ